MKIQQQTVALKDGATTWFGYYRVKVTHLPRTTWRVFVLGVIFGVLLTLSIVLSWPSWLFVIFLYQTSWLGLELLACLGMLTIRAKDE